MKLERWLVDDDSKTFDLPKNVIRLTNKFDKIKLSIKAQQKLIKSIKSTSQDLIIEIPNPLKIGQKESNFVLLPTLKISSCNAFEFSKRLIKWNIRNNGKGTNNNEKVEIYKQKIMKEPLVLSKSCKVLMTESLRKDYEIEINDIEKFVSNPYFIEPGLEPVLKPIPKQLSFKIWENDDNLNDIEEVLDENLNIPQYTPSNKRESFDFIPKTFFGTDYLLETNLLPISKSYDYLNSSNLITNKWDFSKSIEWKTDNLIVNQILNEEINEFELKYKISINPINITKKSKNITKNFKNWQLSEYQETIINWKPFAKLKLQDTLNEECSTSIPITMPLNIEDDKYIKYSEIRTGRTRGYTLEFNEVVVNLNTSEREIIIENNEEPSGNEYIQQMNKEKIKRIEEAKQNNAIDEIRRIKGKIDGNSDSKEEYQVTGIINHGKNMENVPLFVSQYSNESTRVSKPPSPILIIGNNHVDEIIPNLQSAETSNTSILTTNNNNTKRKSDDFDSLVLKKRKKSKPIQFDFNQKYPYLDILNQTSTMLMTYNQSNIDNSRYKNNDDSLIESKGLDEMLQDIEVVHVPLPEGLKNKNKNKNKHEQQTEYETDNHNDKAKLSNEILEFTESDFSYSMFNIPESKIVNIYVNIKFADKFGAAFLKFNEIIETDRHFNLIDFSISESGRQSRNNLEYDLFLNPSCGVIFLRTINVYQVDIKTGENLIFKQISEIAYQVLSMIIIIIIEDGIDIEEDNRLLEFIENSENYGITIYIINNNPKLIATSIIELIQEFSNFENSEFRWDSKHQFLETCGVWNPCLSNFILNNWKLEEFIMMSNNKRIKNLETICSIQLIDKINMAVQKFNGDR